MKAFIWFAILGAASASAWGQGARVVVHPLELREMTAAQQEIVQAQFDVMLARLSDIRLAGSAAVEEARRKPAGKDCETRDECLRFFAEATESLYAVYARVRPDPLGKRLVVNARVVRSDGAVIKKVTLDSQLGEGPEQTEIARELLLRLLEELELNKLSATLRVEPAVLPVTPSELPVAAASARRSVGFALLGIGAVTLVVGGVLAGLAVDGRSKLTLDSRGRAPESQAVRARDVAREAQVATVMIPVGALVAALGVALAWWPTESAVAVSTRVGESPVGVSLGGAFW